MFVAQKVAKRLVKSPKASEQNATATATNGNVNCGKLVRQVTYQTVKCFTWMSLLLLIITVIFSIILFISAVGIKNNLGKYINMIAGSDGDVLPTMQAIPALFFLIMNITAAVVIFQIFSTGKNPLLNWILFSVIMLSVLLMFIVFILLFVIMQHMYKAHEELHNGIVEAMKNYSTNSVLKRQMDRLQIELQCCGSKKYDEWYNITWYDANLVKPKTYDKSQGNTPFSCCSMTSSFPCIHHNIENTGKIYLYTPELNLSISTKGCYDILRQKKQEFGWGIIGNLFLYLVFQGALVVFLRFIQTAHCEKSRFEGHRRLYTIWLIGCYSEEARSGPKPPEPPPVPPELMK